MILSAIYINCFVVNAQDILEITGPVYAFENEEVEFTVTLNGEPTQARVIFETISPAKSSNQTTGKVAFTTPSVNQIYKKYKVTASILNELTASHTILVKNRTGILKIELSNDYIVEMDVFNITVKNRDEPIIGANVWFNSDVYITDSNGKVSLTAPDVLVTTNFGLMVNKTGYTTNSTMITIYEADLGLKLMEVVTPHIVEPEQQNIEITVISKNGGIENASIELFYEGIKYGEYQTDSDGKAIISTPAVNYDYNFSLYVYKDGYDTYTSDKKINVFLYPCDFASDLVITLNPSEIEEGDEVTVEVTDEVGLGVQGAGIWRGATRLDESTDSEGILIFIAPSVLLDREFYIYAVKEGYNYAEGRITIRDKGSYQEELTIETVNIVNESEIFYVTILDSNNFALKDVAVTFDTEQKLTNTDGIVSFIAPSVANDAFYTINVTRYGYHPASSSIEVINVDSSNGTPSRELVIHVIPNVIENEEFTVKVKNKQGDAISDVKVSFNGIDLNTDFKGTVSFTAPNVDHDITREIQVLKSGYTSDSIEIIIKNTEEFQYWYLILIIIIILIVGLVAYFRNRTMI